MICNKCGTDVPAYSKFCIRCGNRLVPADAVAPQQPSQSAPPPEKPKPASSGSPFGGKQISDRHYSLEDIARQQEESNNSIGLPSAPPDRNRKKRRRQPDAALPPVGTSDSMELNAGSSAGTSSAAQQPSDVYPAKQPMMNPLLQPLSELTKSAPQKGKPIRHEEKMPQPSGSANPLLQSLSELTKEPPKDKKPVVSSTEAAARREAAQNRPVPAVSAAAAAPASSAPEPTATPAPPSASAAPAYTGQVYRYSITTPPVPSGLQQQTNISLFDGDIRTQVDNLRKEYFARRNGTNASQ